MCNGLHFLPNQGKQIFLKESASYNNNIFSKITTVLCLTRVPSRSLGTEESSGARNQVVLLPSSATDNCVCDHGDRQCLGGGGTVRSQSLCKLWLLLLHSLSIMAVTPQKAHVCFCLGRDQYLKSWFCLLVRCGVFWWEEISSVNGGIHTVCQTGDRILILIDTSKGAMEMPGLTADSEQERIWGADRMPGRGRERRETGF